MTDTDTSWRPDQTARAGAAWQGLMVHLQGRLAFLRLQLENKANDHDATQYLRGQIFETKRLLALDTDLPQVGT
jgi:hypothetical protein